MLNHRPIFIVGFTRGGTNLLLNAFLSHAEVCTPRGELQQVFKGARDESVGIRVAKLMRYLPILLRQGQDVFSTRRNRPPRPLRTASSLCIDRVLFEDKLRATGSTQNRFRTENEEYSRSEIERARLLCKNVDGAAFLTSALLEMYPDATFLCLVRHGYAVCEGHVRRGVPVGRIAQRYEAVCRRMIDDAGRYPNVHIVRYEDLVSCTSAELRRVFGLAGLDFEAVPKFRLVVSEDRTGSSHSSGGADTLKWYTLQELEEAVTPEYNEAQIRRLDRVSREAFLAVANGSMKALGYE